jgi:hypothetical protein
VGHPVEFIDFFGRQIFHMFAQFKIRSFLARGLVSRRGGERDLRGYGALQGNRGHHQREQRRAA